MAQRQRSGNRGPEHRNNPRQRNDLLLFFCGAIVFPVRDGNNIPSGHPGGVPLPFNFRFRIVYGNIAGRGYSCRPL